MKQFLKSDDGATAGEYALILAILGGMVIVAAIAIAASISSGMGSFSGLSDPPAAGAGGGQPGKSGGGGPPGNPGGQGRGGGPPQDPGGQGRGGGPP